MKRSAERRIGIGRWLMGLLIVGAALVALFSLVPSALLERLWVSGINAEEVRAYADLLDLKPKEERKLQVTTFHMGGSHADGSCWLDEVGPGWHRRWFEADGYGDSVDVRRSSGQDGMFHVRFDREAPFDTQRSIELLPAAADAIRAKYLEVLATELGLLTPEVSFVRVIACGKDQGLYIKQEHMGSAFLEKHLMADGARFTQGFEPDRPDHLLPRFADDTLAARTLRAALEQVSSAGGPSAADAASKLVDERAAIGWLLMRWMEGGDPFGAEGHFVYRWNTGRILPLYQRRADTPPLVADSGSPVNFNVLSLLLMRPAFQAALNERRDKLLSEQARILERFAALDTAWLPVLAGDASLTVAQARARAIASELFARLQQDVVPSMSRLMVPGVGYAMAQGGTDETLMQHSDDATLAQRLVRMKARVSGDTVVFPRGRYFIEEDLILPIGHTVIVEQGARFEIAPQRSVLFQGPLVVRGTRRNPVFVRAQQKDTPFGTFALHSINNVSCVISGLLISGGSGSLVNGIRHEGMVSIHGAGSVAMSDCVIEGAFGRNALRIVGGSISLSQCAFEGDQDLASLDHVTGSLRGCSFKGGKSARVADGVRLSGSRLLLQNCRSVGIKGAGVNAGTGSQVLLRDGRFEANGTAVVAQDRAVVYVFDNVFTGNALVFGAYGKQASNGGGRLMLGTNTYERNTKDRDVDGRSSVVVQDPLTEEITRMFEAR